MGPLFQPASEPEDEEDVREYVQTPLSCLDSSFSPREVSFSLRGQPWACGGHQLLVPWGTGRPPPAPKAPLVAGLEPTWLSVFHKENVIQKLHSSITILSFRSRSSGFHTAIFFAIIF